MTNCDAISKLAVWKTTVAISDWHYAKFKIASNDKLTVAIEELSVRMQLAKALEAGFGIVGSSAHIDLLQWDEEAHTGILRISHDQFTMLVNAVSMATFKVDGQLCTFRIIDDSAHLLSLASNSRDYMF
ncbi:unnamed protein product [Umbelopsis ramanniana]